MGCIAVHLSEHPCRVKGMDSIRQLDESFKVFVDCFAQNLGDHYILSCDVYMIFTLFLVKLIQNDFLILEVVSKACPG